MRRRPRLSATRRRTPSSIIPPGPSASTGRRRTTFSCTPLREEPRRLADGTFAPALLLLHSHRSEEHTSELQSLMRISYAVFCLKKKIKKNHKHHNDST